MGCDVVDHIVEHHLGGVLSGGGEIEGDVGDGVGLHLEVGLDAAAIAHLSATCGVEHLGQRVRDVLAIARAALLVVDGLDAAPAGDVVFRGGYLHIRVIGQVDGNLHQALAVGARP